MLFTSKNHEKNKETMDFNFYAFFTQSIKNHAKYDFKVAIIKFN